MATAIPAAEAFESGPFTAGSSKPFGEVVDERDRRFDNQPPLEDRIMLEFEEELERLGVKSRVAELIESAAKCPARIEDEETAGKAGDLRKLARAVRQKIDEAREKHNRPILNAQRALKGKADSIIAPLDDAMAKVQQRLNSYVAEQEAKRREERRRIEEEERKAREALREAEISEEVIAQTIVAPPLPPKPIARGNYGSAVSGRTVWRHERQVPIAKLPKQILENAQVVEAVDKVIAAMIRSGAREIKGVRIFETTEATVR